MSLVLKQFNKLPKDLKPYFILVGKEYIFKLNLGNAFELFYAVALFEFLKQAEVDPKVTPANIFKSIKALNLDYSSSIAKPISKLESETFYNNNGTKDTLTTTLSGIFAADTVEPILGTITQDTGAKRSIARTIFKEFKKIDDLIPNQTNVETAVYYYKQKIKEFMSLSGNLTRDFNTRNETVIKEIYEKRKKLLEDKKIDKIFFELKLTGTNTDSRTGKQQKIDFVLDFTTRYTKDGVEVVEEKPYTLSLKYADGGAVMWNPGESGLIDLVKEKLKLSRRPSTFFEMGTEMTSWFAEGGKTPKQQKDAIIELYRKMQFDDDPNIIIMNLGSNLTTKLNSFTTEITNVFGADFIKFYVDVVGKDYINIKYHFSDIIFEHFFKIMFTSSTSYSSWNRFFHFRHRTDKTGTPVDVITGMVLTSNITPKKLNDLKTLVDWWKTQTTRKNINRLQKSDIADIAIKMEKVLAKADQPVQDAKIVKKKNAEAEKWIKKEIAKDIKRKK